MPPGVPNDCCTSGIVAGGSSAAVYGGGTVGHSVNGAVAKAAAGAGEKGALALRGAAPPSGKPVSLLIAIPTIPRRSKTGGNVNYLTGTVESLVRESIASSSASKVPLFTSVEILVLSHGVSLISPHSSALPNVANRKSFRGGAAVESEHPDFVALKTKYSGGEERGVVDLPAADTALGALKLLFKVDGGEARSMDPHADDQPPVDDRKNPDDRPGKRVRQQSMDVIALVTAAEESGAEYVLFTEDDAELCPGTLPAVARAISHANSYTAGRGAEPGAGWSLVRFSIGFIGILVPAPALPSMRSFFQRYYLIKPPDLMLIEWMHVRAPHPTAAATSLS